MDGAVVVGVDAAQPPLPAVDWAAAQAVRRGADLVLVAAVQPVGSAEALTGYYVQQMTRELQEQAVAAIDDVTRRVQAEHPRLRLVPRVVEDHPRRALVQAVTEGRAQLLVTGARRHNPHRRGLFGGLLLGSTSLFAVAHAPCPVAVVRGPEPPSGGVVVGHDGSPAAGAALGFAVTEALARSAPLRILRVLEPLQRLAIDDDEDNRARAGALRVQREALGRLCAELRAAHPDLRLDCEVLEEAYPADALLRAGEEAELLVVGGRGHGAFYTALLGSVSHDVLHRAEHPVVVVGDPGRRRARPDGVQSEAPPQMT
ncbi:universal stress protein [Kineococcus gynurae]|uniref:Universal stress protein n=1 Tax=Kineococcus gynurae TaxID=452979 RepID=A0ABV5LP90_9ACTN